MISIGYIIGGIMILALILLSFTSRSMEDTMLKGFWKADAEFCKIAQLEMFVLYLGDNTNYIGNTRNGYLLAANESSIILNNPIKVTFNPSMDILPGFSSCKKYRMSIDWRGEDPENDAFPSIIDAAYYPKYGKLVLYNKDKVYAILWRDLQLSAMDAGSSLTPDEVVSQSSMDNADENAGGESIGADGIDI